MAECARNSRTHPPQNKRPGANADSAAARRAIVRTLRRVEAMLRCRLPQGAAACQPPKFPRVERTGDRPSLLAFRRDRESDEPRLGALRAPDSWRGWPRL